MPFISTKTSVSVSDAKREEIKKLFGKAIEIFPGKSERWLMLSFEDNIKMYFAGSDASAAFVEVMLLGKGSSTSFDKMTAEVCKIISGTLEIPQDRIYVKYEECDHWGWNGGNF